MGCPVPALLAGRLATALPPRAGHHPHACQPVAIGATEAGEPRLRSWWIPADAAGRFSRYTALYLHSENGNLSHTLDALATLHATGVNVLAFDYRGYGQSQFARPSEARWREDAEWALNYLTGTRHIAAKSIVLDGKELGANLALELAARHPELAGLVLESPSETAVDAIFNDARARLVPAHILVRDRFELDAPAAALRIPSLWFFKATEPLQPILYQKPTAFEKVTSAKMQVWFPRFPEAKKESIEAAALTHWLGDLQ